MSWVAKEVLFELERVCGGMLAMYVLGSAGEGWKKMNDVEYAGCLLSQNASLSISIDGVKKFGGKV
jgi:hypothetical protein